MIYRPGNGAMWDPSILWHGGRYHAFMMYNRDGNNGLEAGHCLLAVSEDGVHWRDEAVVLEERERERGCKFFKCMVARCGDRFIMDHGVARPEGQDMLRFYESTDLKNWTHLFSSRPDPRWYGLPPEPHRWDHMYILPKEENNPSAGYWGHPVSVAKPGQPRGVGMMQSPDGRAWDVLPPARVEWGDRSPIDLEWGGCERLDGKFYLIGGGGYLGFKGYGMFVFVADDPRGPFRPQADAMRLCGNSEQNISWLAVWCRGSGELLISNYASMSPGDMSPWLLPLRKPVVDRSGVLRLGWWKGNEALKGRPLALSRTSTTFDGTQGYAATYLDETFSPERGVVLEGTLRAQALAAGAAAGLALDEGEGTSLATLMGIGAPEGRETRIGHLQAAAGTFNALDVTGKHCATVTGLEDGREHTFRLLSRRGMFELYVDDLLMQTYVYKPGAGRLGFAVRNAKADIKSLRAWEMSL
jgi:hypothetical protein